MNTTRILQLLIAFSATALPRSYVARAENPKVQTLTVLQGITAPIISEYYAPTTWADVDAKGKKLDGEQVRLTGYLLFDPNVFDGHDRRAFFGVADYPPGHIPTMVGIPDVYQNLARKFKSRTKVAIYGVLFSRPANGDPDTFNHQFVRVDAIVPVK